MNRLKRYGLWVLLSLPGWWLVWLWVSGDSSAHYLLLPSGKYAIRMTVIALAVTPLNLLFPRSKWCVWLLKSRRAIGVAAVGYAVLHTILYFIDEGGLAGAMGDLTELEIIVGWLAMLVFAILGASSNNWSMRKLGKYWKLIQRGAYLAIFLSFLHWFLLGYYLVSMLTHLLPLLVLQTIRLWFVLRNKQTLKVNVTA